MGKFQSTPPARGATLLTWRLDSIMTYFNPRPPRGGRLHMDPGDDTWKRISIHAPREGGDSGPLWTRKM